MEYYRAATGIMHWSSSLSHDTCICCFNASYLQALIANPAVASDLCFRQSQHSTYTAAMLPLINRGKQASNFMGCCEPLLQNLEHDHMETLRPSNLH